MPRPKGIPAYKLHKASGQARVIIDGRHVYLGPYGSPESHEKYGRVIAEYLQQNLTCPQVWYQSLSGSLSV